MVTILSACRETLTETPTSVQAAKHTSTKESRCEFNIPPVVLQGYDAGETQTIESPADVPIIDLCRTSVLSAAHKLKGTHNTGGVTGHDLITKDDDEGKEQA